MVRTRIALNQTKMLAAYIPKACFASRGERISGMAVCNCLNQSGKTMKVNPDATSRGFRIGRYDKGSVSPGLVIFAKSVQSQAAAATGPAAMARYLLKCLATGQDIFRPVEATIRTTNAGTTPQAISGQVSEPSIQWPTCQENSQADSPVASQKVPACRNWRMLPRVAS